jgi:hypothetical protein
LPPSTGFLSALMSELPARRSRSSGSEKRARKSLVMVRLDDAERAELEARAGDAGLSLAAFLRAAGLGQAGPRARRKPPIERALLAHTNASLNRVGNNLNQIARALNGDESVMRHTIIEAGSQLLGVLAQLRRSLGYDSQG